MRLSNVWRLGIKELYGLKADPVLLFMILFVFTFAIYTASQVKFEVEGASIGIVDEDQSELSRRIEGALLLPYFAPPVSIEATAIDRSMNSGNLLFVIEIPPKFEQDVLAGRQPTLQINVDATALTLAGNGASDLSNIILKETLSFIGSHEGEITLPVKLVSRARFNPNLYSDWFNSIMALINNITLLAIVLVGSALLREREHGTVEYLLVMPVQPAEILVAKVWANGLVIVVSALGSLWFVIHGLIGVPLAGSVLLFLTGTTLYQVSVAALGILLATFCRSIAQFGLLTIPVIVVLDLLSGSATPMESMPPWLQNVMQLAPTTHFVSFAQAVLYRAAGLEIVWPQIAALSAFTAVFLAVSLFRFRAAIAGFQ